MYYGVGARAGTKKELLPSGWEGISGVDNNIVQYYHIEKLLKIIAIYRYWVVIDIVIIILKYWKDYWNSIINLEILK